MKLNGRNTSSSGIIRMKGWFDAFRHDGGPTLYDRANRTAVTGDVPTITFCVIFITLFVAFLIVLPGMRKEVSYSFFLLFLQLFRESMRVAYRDQRSSHQHILMDVVCWYSSCKRLTIYTKRMMATTTSTKILSNQETFTCFALAANFFFLFGSYIYLRPQRAPLLVVFPTM